MRRRHGQRESTSGSIVEKGCKAVRVMRPRKQNLGAGESKRIEMNPSIQKRLIWGL